tara:strand:+ start:193 stop:843 length:651 start_codon:yes stop_codon:yes gene_type:complete
MIKKIQASKSEKILFVFLISLTLFTFISFFLLKNKCLFVTKVNVNNLNFNYPENIAIMDLECGNVIIELYPDIAPNTVERFKNLIHKKMYDGSAFYKVIDNTIIQAGDMEFGNIKYLNYSKIGSGKSGFGLLKSELSDEFEFTEGSIGFSRSTEFNTEDSEFFITLKKIPIYQGEYTPVGKVLYGLDILKTVKKGDNTNYVLRPDYIKTFRMFNFN